MNGIFPLICKE